LSPPNTRGRKKRRFLPCPRQKTPADFWRKQGKQKSTAGRGRSRTLFSPRRGQKEKRRVPLNRQHQRKTYHPAFQVGEGGRNPQKRRRKKEILSGRDQIPQRSVSSHQKEASGARRQKHEEEKPNARLHLHDTKRKERRGHAGWLGQKKEGLADAVGGKGPKDVQADRERKPQKKKKRGASAWQKKDGVIVWLQGETGKKEGARGLLPGGTKKESERRRLGFGPRRKRRRPTHVGKPPARLTLKPEREGRKRKGKRGSEGGWSSLRRTIPKRGEREGIVG